MVSTVFFSSTCYDLIDLRSELQELLKAMGLEPVMSDRPSAEFSVIPDRNSIESCLANVRKADIFIVILSQRYGPSLKKAGYSDISATHMEYKEARHNKKPIYMYVRDRLEADFNIWKKNKGKRVNLSWVKSGDERIFNLLSEHRKLTVTKKQSNWFWIFRDSVELRERVKQDLRLSAGEAILRKLMDSGRLAYLIPQIEKWHIDKKNRILSITVTVTNAGTATAIQPFITLHSDMDEDVRMIRTLLPGQSLQLEFSPKVKTKTLRSANPTMWMVCNYTTPEGHYLGDEYYLEFAWKPRHATGDSIADYSYKRYYHSSGISLKTGDEE